jgi:hypothetical protein
VDIETNDLEETNDRFAKLSMKDKQRAYEREKKVLWNYLNTRKKSTFTIINSDTEFKELRKLVNADFTARFSQGYTAYIAGEWQEAKTDLMACL